MWNYNKQGSSYITEEFECTNLKLEVLNYNCRIIRVVKNTFKQV